MSGSTDDQGRAQARREYLPGADEIREFPNNAQAEQAILGNLFLSPSICLEELSARNFRPEFFYDLRHQVILGRVLERYRTGEAIDLIAIAEALKKTGELEQVGGLPYLGTLPDVGGINSLMDYYMDIVVEKWQLRTLLRLCAGIQQQVYEFTGTVDELLAQSQKTFLEMERATAPMLERDVRTILRDQVQPNLEEHYTRGRAQMRGIPTGLEYLDKILCGLGGKNGNYVVLAARPNVGKTSEATQWALHTALNYEHWDPVPADYAPAKGENVSEPNEKGQRFVHRVGVPVGISSLEMTAGALVEKMLFQRGGADLERWRTGFADNSDFTRLVTAAGELGRKNNIVIDDTPRLKIGQLKARWRRWYRQYGVRYFILDYLQLMQPDERRGRTDRVQELAEISAELQALGKELQCPMVILAQMNRDYEKDPNRAPRMSDLKDCGAVEQDADVIMFLYAPRLSDTNKEFFENAMDRKFGPNWKKSSTRPERINVLVAKNRFGPKGKAELLLLHSSTVFTDWNVWLKNNGLKKAAAGESQYRDVSDEQPED